MQKHNKSIYDEFRKIVLEAKPKLIIAGGSAYSRQIDFKKMADVAHEVDAIFMVDMAHFAGTCSSWFTSKPCGICRYRYYNNS